MGRGGVGANGTQLKQNPAMSLQEGMGVCEKGKGRAAPAAARASTTSQHLALIKTCVCEWKRHWLKWQRTAFCAAYIAVAVANFFLS